jgi:hypothetical protein
MYNNQIINSANKIKATRNIIKSETNRLEGHTVIMNIFMPQEPEHSNALITTVLSLKLLWWISWNLKINFRSGFCGSEC